MKVHKLAYPEKPDTEGIGYSVAAGFFDGIHRGHQQVIGHAAEVARKEGLVPAVMTFDPHPSAVLGNKKDVTYITPLEQKLEILSDMGVGAVFVIRFSKEFASLTPEEFIECYIKGIGARHITTGFDFTFGKFGKGTPDTLRQLANGAYGVSVVGKVEDGGEKVSSTRVRKLLAEGDVQGAAGLLGRPLMTDGIVIEGDKRGRTIGFPTANVRPAEGACLPAPGVYAVFYESEGNRYPGVLNAGFRPTFKDPDKSELSVEVHLIGFEGDLYGRSARIRWMERIREERKFDGIGALKEQIGRDKDQAVKILQEYAGS
ncbi:bifunctional riboflavin kinase/FAD synthetase [Edaphobacillus lindanitolerans]|uniref:Riboflavin biosynthesis protein n=1 Tax=Edaphobacillus lindanitolerans TaxID=550447 RepID=A0A1U7PLK5_9BACI|nr:bifunctional riboflavin kinase/FAD synthetase [Edaphobacillus lindanitolerans]SIT67242.1 riboflavin kinase / FMN adenylyltransferase [Edaphobacillus lindanitolerans]